jgi:putative transposase|tara:strand:- start:177 stop:1076 length:900 start_codon:yes stop_codon:yes gene_type:complete
MEEKKQKWITRRYLAGMPTKKIAAHLQIPLRTTYSVIQHYKKFGDIARPKPIGRPKLEITHQFRCLVQEEWNKFQCGSVKLHKILNTKGYGVSQRKIQEVMDECKLTAPCPKRRGQRKYCSYRWPEGFFVLHTDWAICPVSGKQLIAYIDDYSRFIVGYGLYDNSTGENTIHCLYRVVFEHGIPHAIITDRGSCFYATKIGKKKKGRSKFQELLDEMGIQHIVARPHHPQTNGKIERWFGTYKREFNERFKSIEEYVRFYNYERPHQRLGYKTPAQVFFKEEGVQHFEIARVLDEKKNK